MRPNSKITKPITELQLRCLRVILHEFECLTLAVGENQDCPEAFSIAAKWAGISDPEFDFYDDVDALALEGISRRT
jgi:hypothetical protein